MTASENFIILGNESGTPTLLYHANAYNPEMYQPFLRHFPDRKFIALRQRPLWDDKVKSIKDWSLFTDDLIRFCDEQGFQHIDFMGHSLGATSAWKAASKRQDLFKKIVLIDPVALPEEIVKWVGLLPFKLKARIRPIIKIATLRKNVWESKEEARAHLGSKSVFKKFDPEVFDLFIEYGIKEIADGKVGLSFPREWEAMIYASPENVWKFIGKTKQEIFVIKAEHSNVISEESWSKIQQTQKLNTYVEMPDVGHLIPFEQPEKLADLIKAYLE